MRRNYITKVSYLQSGLERLYEGKEEITHLGDISATRYIAFSKRVIG